MEFPIEQQIEAVNANTAALERLNASIEKLIEVSMGELNTLPGGANESTSPPAQTTASSSRSTAGAKSAATSASSTKAAPAGKPDPSQTMLDATASMPLREKLNATILEIVRKKKQTVAVELLKKFGAKSTVGVPNEKLEECLALAQAALAE